MLPGLSGRGGRGGASRGGSGGAGTGGGSGGCIAAGGDVGTPRRTMLLRRCLAEARRFLMVDVNDGMMVVMVVVV